MGGNVSSGNNNDELVDNLIESGLIKTNLVERVFRTVDRGLFYLPKSRSSAYRDLAWREGHIHISAPCIYTRVLESLELRANQSFLNIGSGTGYLSSMVGLILGPYGVNHNIELHADLIEYARDRLGEFVRTAAYFDDFDFCAPKFVHGNFLNLATSNAGGGVGGGTTTDEGILYDRIYVGAGVSDEHEEFIKSFLKIDGVLIMPLNDCLMKIRRINETLYEKNSIMTVSYASLITDSVDPNKKFSMPKLKPLTLQEICRYKIRQTVRETIEKSDADYYKVKREMSTFNKNKRRQQQHSSSSSSSQQKRCRRRRQQAAATRRRTTTSGDDNEQGPMRRNEGAADDDDNDDDDDYDDGDEEEQEGSSNEDNMYDEYDLYDSDEDFGGGSGTGDDENTGSGRSNYAAIARFERIFRPRLGLNISYARIDNQLRLLIGHGRLPTNANSSRPSPQQETPSESVTSTAAAIAAAAAAITLPNSSSVHNFFNDDDDEDDENRHKSNASTATTPQNQQQQSTSTAATTSSNSSTRSRLSWLPILSFRSEDYSSQSSSSSSAAAANTTTSETPSHATSVAAANYSSSSELETSPSGAQLTQNQNTQVITAPLSRKEAPEYKCSGGGSTSESGFSEGSSSRLSFNCETSDLNVNSKRKRNLSNGYNSETDLNIDPSDADLHEIDTKPLAIKTAVVEEQEHVSAGADAEALSSSSASSFYKESGSSDDYSSLVVPPAREAAASPVQDEDQDSFKTTNEDDESKDTLALPPPPATAAATEEKKYYKEVLKKSKRENLLRKRIIGLPLSPHMIAFLLYNREI